MNKRRFEHATEGTYWEISVTGSWLNALGGASGQAGEADDARSFDTEAAAEAEAARRIEERLARGYREVAEPAAGTFDAQTLWKLISERSEAPLPPLAGTFDDELAAWRAIAPAADLSMWAERMVFVDPLDPAEIGFGQYVRRMTEEVYGCATVCALFSNVALLCAWDNDDERTFLVSRTPAVGGFHRVYYFDPRRVELDDHGWPSIGAFVWRDREERVELPAVEPAHLDPRALSRRSTWLTSALAGVGYGSMEEDTQHIADVASFDAESSLLEHPHLACYWLLHHAIAGNARMLATTLERTEHSTHPWVRGLRGLISRDQDIGCVDRKYRDEFARSAPRRAFGS